MNAWRRDKVPNDENVRREHYFKTEPNVGFDRNGNIETVTRFPYALPVQTDGSPYIKRSQTCRITATVQTRASSLLLLLPSRRVNHYIYYGGGGGRLYVHIIVYNVDMFDQRRGYDCHVGGDGEGVLTAVRVVTAPCVYNIRRNDTASVYIARAAVGGGGHDVELDLWDSVADNIHAHKRYCSLF